MGMVDFEKIQHNNRTFKRTVHRWLPNTIRLLERKRFQQTFRNIRNEYFAANGR